jgi:hypothetical protein
LTLFVLGVFADDANHAAAVNDFALIAYLLDGRADLHITPELQPLALSHWHFANGGPTQLGSLFQLEAKS